MDKEDVIYIYLYHRMEYYSALKEGNSVICNSMDETGGQYAKWNKPVKERQILYSIIYMWNLKKKLNS